MAVKAPALRALGFAPGSRRLIGARWLLAIVAALPGVLAAGAMLGESAGRQPWFTEAPDPLPLAQMGLMLGEVGGATPVLMIGVVVAWILLLLMTAAAVEAFDPRRPPGPVRLWRGTFDTGARFLWVYLRIAFFAAALIGLWGWLLSFVFGKLLDRAEVTGWSASKIIYGLGISRVLLLLAGAGVIGLLAAWGRVFAVSGNRRHVRRLPTMGIRVCNRFLFQGFIVPLVVGAA